MIIRGKDVGFGTKFLVISFRHISERWTHQKRILYGLSFERPESRETGNDCNLVS